MNRFRSVASAKDRRSTSTYVSLASTGRRALTALVPVVVAALALGACGGSSGSGSGAVSGSLTNPGQYGKLPPPGTSTHGGTITYGQLNGLTPNYIFPILPSGNGSTFTEQWQQIMWLPLYNNFAYGSSPGVNYKLSVAKKPVFSDGDKTVTIQLNQGYKWSDGKSVDAQDLLFDIALIKVAVGESAANWSSFTPGYFPQSLASISATGPYTVVMHLKRAFNPGFFLNNQLARGSLPASEQSVERRLGRRPAPELERARQRQEDLRLPGQGGRPGGDVFLQSRCGRSPTGRSCFKASMPSTTRGP